MLMLHDPQFMSPPKLPDWVNKFIAHIERGEGADSGEIELSEAVRRAIFFAKYEAHIRKSSEVSMDDLRAGIERETRKR
jgi:hypothetical protein